jgi:hypothetical protein
MLTIVLREVPHYLSGRDMVDISVDFVLDLVSSKSFVYYGVIKGIDRNRSFGDPRRCFGGEVDDVIKTRTECNNRLGSKCQVKTPQGYENGKRSQKTANHFRGASPLMFKSYRE